MNDAVHAEVAPAATDTTAGRRLSFAFAKRHGVLVHRFFDGVAECIYRDTASPHALAEVRRYLRCPLRLERVPEAQFDQLLRQAYEAGSDAMQAVEGLDETTDLAHLAQDLPEQADLLDSEDDAPIIRLINAVLTQAVKENASDIHIEPFENRLVIRFRVDGVLREVGEVGRVIEPFHRLHGVRACLVRLPQQRVELRFRHPLEPQRAAQVTAHLGERLRGGGIAIDALGDAIDHAVHQHPVTLGKGE